eukprot:934692-Rhodomonas_salina.1
MLVECGRRMDNDAGDVEMCAIEKEEPEYHSARVVLRAGLRRERGLGWHAGHLSFITGWKTTINESTWAENLTQLGIQTVRHRRGLQRSAEAVLRAFGSMTDARMGAGDGSVT